MNNLKEKARYLEPVMRIGKNGLTEGTIIEIKKQLKKKKLIKIKFLRAFLGNNDKKQAAKEISEKTESIIIDQVGFVVVLWRR
ncbi:YhbY family RNA-binding protein [Candidatus Woesearchaeota archaeon]|nr:YhbY family RNA-binding protein [Candidatus Woesearchaeota archaeon]